MKFVDGIIFKTTEFPDDVSSHSKIVDDRVATSSFSILYLSLIISFTMFNMALLGDVNLSMKILIEWFTWIPATAFLFQNPDMTWILSCRSRVVIWLTGLTNDQNLLYLINHNLLAERVLIRHCMCQYYTKEHFNFYMRWIYQK